MIGGFGLAPAVETVEAAAAVATSTDVDFVIVLSCGGESVTLADPYRVLADAEGLDDAEGQPVTQPYTALDGEAYAGVSYAGRDVFLPVMVVAETGTAWEAARAALRRVLNPRRGLTTVSVVRPDGSYRRVTGPATTRGGAWGVDTWNVRGWQRLGILVRALTAWWITDDALTVPWSGAAAPSWFDGDLDARTLAPDRTIGDPVTVQVPGDVETYPTVTITGAATTVTFTDPVTGRSWTVDCTGLAMPVTVVADPAASAVTDGTGADCWTALSPGSDLWPLQPGDQQIVVTAAGTSTSTQIVLTAPACWFAAVA